MTFKNGHNQSNAKKRKKTMLKKYGKLTINVPKTTTTKICNQCRKEFSGPYWYVKDMKFCSNKCVGNYNRTRICSKETAIKISKALTGRHLSKQCKKKKSIYIINFYKKNPQALQKFIDAGKKNHPRYSTNQGFLVRSKSEQKIANWCWRNNIEVEYESQKIFYKNKILIPDFYIPKFNLFIEYYGNFRNLARRKIKFKKKTYKKLGIKVIEIDSMPINKIEEVLDESFISFA